MEKHKIKSYQEYFEFVEIFDTEYVYFVIKLFNFETGEIIKYYRKMFKYEEAFIDFCKKYYRHL